MKILHISDTHSRHKEIKNMPEADIVIHSGDITENGTEDEVLDFIKWFESLNYKYKIFVHGNHDLSLYGNDIEGLMENTFFLENKMIEIEGLQVYGTFSGNFDYIPYGTDILITHIPPLGILDGTEVLYGDYSLLKKVFEIKPKLHLFGHIHESPGQEIIDNVTFSNASSICMCNIFNL